MQEPSQHRDVDQSIINANATTMMEIQGVNDVLSDLIVRYIRLSTDQVEAAVEVDEFLNGSIQDRLTNGSWSSISSSSLLSENGSKESRDGSEEDVVAKQTGLVPFKRTRKETRKPSFKAR